MKLERIDSSAFLPLTDSDAREVVGGVAASTTPILHCTAKTGVRGPDGQLAIIDDYE